MASINRIVTAVALAVLVALACTARSAEARTPLRPAARLALDASMIRVGASLRVDPRASRLPRGPGRRVISLSFGDHSRPLRLRRLQTRTHRYGRAGRYTITLTLTSGHRAWTTKRTVTVGKRTVTATPAAGTLIAADADIAAITGDPNATQTVVLRAGAPPLPRGGMLVLPASRSHPDGLLGRVTALAHRSDGRTRLTLAPATLDEAYRTVTIKTDGTLADPGVLVVDAAGRVLRSAPRAAGPAASIHFGGAGVRCTGGLNGPLSIDVDLSPLHWQLDFDLRNPFIHFLVAGSPKITAVLGLAAAGECHLTLPLHVVIPIAGTPLAVKISPRLELSADGGLSGHFTWTPRLAYGFDRGNGVSQNLHAFNLGSVKPDLHADAKAELFFGPDAELSLGGVVGVSAAFGPAFAITLNQTPGSSCLRGDVALKIDASAHANVFIKHWSFALLSITAHDWPLFDTCPSPPGGNTPGQPSAGNGGGGLGGGNGPAGNGTVGSGRASRISAGAAHTCAIVDEGRVACWGLNNDGQLGDGTTTQRLTPVLVSGIMNATAITTGSAHSCALLATGRVACWGDTYHGQIGDGTPPGTSTDRLTPVEVPAITNAISISADGGHSCVLRDDDEVDCWGAYQDLGPIGDQATPTSIGQFTDATMISTGLNHLCALLRTGRISCWGDNTYGQLGDGTNTKRSSPVQVSTITDARAITAGGGYTCALLSSGQVDCWGYNNGFLGDGTRDDRWTPVAVSGITNAVTVEGRYAHSCAVLATGQAACWGQNVLGRLGDGTTVDPLTPVRVNTTANFTAISTGYFHTCGTLTTGQVTCWGDNQYGGLGDGTLTNSLTPVLVASIP